MNIFNNRSEIVSFVCEKLLKNGKILGPRLNEHWFKSHKFEQQWTILNRILEYFNFSWQELIFRLLENIEFNKKFCCKACNTEVKFDSQRKLYPRFCSLKCSANSTEVREKTRQTCVKKYGCDCSFQVEEVKEKMKITWKKKYGVDSPNKSGIVKEKSRKTCMERYGVDHPAKTKEFQEKREKYWIDHFGVSNNSQLPDWKEKFKETCLKRYGCEHSSQSKLIQEKIRKTCQEKYGCDNPMQSQEIKERSIKTCQEKYGVVNPGQIPEVKEKIRKSMKEHYGCDHAFQAEEVKEKIKETCREKYGCNSAYQSERIKEKAYKTKKRNGSFGKSKIEDKIYDKLCSKFSIVERQYKSEGYPFMCDFYVPSLDLYIEYQGMWTHGPEPFDSSNLEHLAIVENWKQKSKEINFKGEKKNFYEHAIHGWTISDPNKRLIAQQNNINLLEFFSIDEFEKWFVTI